LFWKPITDFAAQFDTVMREDLGSLADKWWSDHPPLETGTEGVLRAGFPRHDARKRRAPPFYHYWAGHNCKPLGLAVAYMRFGGTERKFEALGVGVRWRNVNEFRYPELQVECDKCRLGHPVGAWWGFNRESTECSRTALRGLLGAYHAAGPSEFYVYGTDDSDRPAPLPLGP
jgi:hypothetical protein